MMVDMEVVKNRVMRGAFVGGGSFLASTAGGLMEEHLGLGDIGTSAGQVVAGAGVSIGVDQVFQDPESLPNEAVEFIGYGVEGAGFANLGEALTTDGTGARSDGEVVRISTDSDGSPARQEEEASAQEEDFLADVA
jgi:hypothetical protein